MKIVFVIPVFNERPTLADLAAGIAEHAAEHEYEILFVDDGSTDGSYEELCRLRDAQPAVRLLKLRRNFGKTAALAAGFARAEGDVVVTMDADLQDEPREIPRLLAKLDEGYDLVCGWKRERHDPWHKTMPSHVYNRWIARTFKLDLHDVNTGFKAMRMEVARSMPLYGDMHRLMAVFAAQMGYRVGEVPVEHHPRRFGQSKYGFSRFYRGALDVLVARFITRHGGAPIHYFGKAGYAAFLLAALSLFMIPAGLLWMPSRLGDAAPEVQLVGAAVVLLWVLVPIVLATFGFLAVGIGMLGELLVRRLPPPDPATYIDDDHAN